MSAFAVLGLLLLLQNSGSAERAPAPMLFPHEKHGRVFPVCEGCHSGIVSGVADRVFPDSAHCQQCHDGTRVKRVAWRSRVPRTSNLRFSHQTHQAELVRTGDVATCLTCHAASDPPRRMVAAGPDPGRCVTCHAHRATAHMTPTAACRTCHVPVTAQPRLTFERISRFPKPAWHDGERFASGHGRVTGVAAASCGVCHARESCERCHANADRVPLITALARDSRFVQLMAGRDAVYETPLSHAAATWRSAHGVNARESAAACANCHTRPSCTTCHMEGSGTARAAIASLPGPGVRPGLGVSPQRITSAVHPPNIVSRHGTLAAGEAMNCAQCHSADTCAGCHVGQESRRFHATDFVERHAVDVFANTGNCVSCHNAERFCRECHAKTGIASSGRMDAAFHTGKANWLLSHGQAARSGMESCASCHRQADCVRCHSATGGWGVNPHRSGFRGNAARSASSCGWCHVAGISPGGR